MSFALCASCVTKNKAVEQTKTEVAAQGSSGNEIDRDLIIKSESEGKNFQSMDFVNAMNAWKIGYDGQLGDSFKFWMNQTDNGFEAGAEGTGTANAEGTNEQTRFEAEAIWKEKFDSLAEVSEKRYAQSEMRYAELQRQLNKEKEVKSTTVGVYIIAGVLLIVVIFLLWLEWRLRKIGKSVQAFLNFKSLLKDG